MGHDVPGRLCPSGIATLGMFVFRFVARANPDFADPADSNLGLE
jgi:hypothetical protein